VANGHAAQVHGGCVECVPTQDKGRVLVAQRAFQQGQVIFSEQPLLTVAADAQDEAFVALRRLCDGRGWDFEPLWYWAALRSLTEDQLSGGPLARAPPLAPEKQEKLLILHQGERNGVSAACAAIGKQFAPRAEAILLERVLQVWVHNAFDYSDDPPGYATYFLPSFMSHSCWPNAFWHYGAGGKNSYVLRARRNIAKGEEITVSYLDESLLLACAPERRWDLWESKLFWCACERCCGGVDRSRGLTCPVCRSGSVFASPGGPSRLASGTLGPGALVGAACGACGCELTLEQAISLSGHEASLKGILDGWQEDGAPSEIEAQQVEELVEACFPQHFLGDRARGRLARLHRLAGRRDEQVRLLEARAAFLAAAYPGLSAARGWMLESLGDALMMRAARGGAPDTEGGDDSLRRGLRAYMEASRILELMFGEDHEYSDGLLTKVAYANAQLQLLSIPLLLPGRAAGALEGPEGGASKRPRLAEEKRVSAPPLRGGGGVPRSRHALGCNTPPVLRG
ncbi:unnamed protein product, partial [Prorocentrum cordatum]